jgi:hypothetical protein
MKSKKTGFTFHESGIIFYELRLRLTLKLRLTPSRESLLFRFLLFGKPSYYFLH